MKTLDEMIREYRIELYKACDGRIGLQAWKYKGLSLIHISEPTRH